MFSYLTFADAIKKILIDVYYSGKTSKVRNYETKEILNYGFIIKNPASNLFYNEIHGSKLQYIAGELLWYFSGKNDVEFISRYSNFWKNICNLDGTCNSAYGNLIFKKYENVTQYKWVIDALTNDIYSRQAVMHFNLPKHQYIENKDFVCTMYANFNIRNDENNIPKLNMSVFMRSNDVVFGLMNDVVFFTMLQIQVFKHLKDNVYPDLMLGEYTHMSNSMHIYEKHYDKVKEMLNHAFEPMELPMIKKDLIDMEGVPNPELINIIKSLDLIESLSNKNTIVKTNFLNQTVKPDDELYTFLLKNANLKNL